MATAPKQRRTREIDYPTGDGKPMAETELHLNDMMDLIQVLGDYFEHDPLVYVAGNLLVFYEEGDRRKHVAPDVFVVRGVEKKKNERGNYLIWKEKKSPDLVLEITSKSTRNEDRKSKLVLYRDILGVSEYFLFDPTEDYLKPSLQGFRLIAGEYVPIEPVDGRLPSQVLGLHLERDGKELRLFDPATGSRLQTPREGREAAERRAAEERRRADEERRRADEERRRAEAAEAARQQSAEENERLRQELEALRRGLKSE